MSTSAYENAAAMLRQQQRTTARLRVGLPALLAHLEHTELLPPDPTDPGGDRPAATADADPPAAAPGPEPFDPFAPAPAPPRWSTD